jgi:hypothetical protein
MIDKKIVFLEDVADKLEETIESWEQFLNTATGEFVAISDGSYEEVDEELYEEIECSDAYVRLPNQHDIREYDIMEAFAEATPDAGKRDRLFRALRGRKPFRNFKDTLGYTGLEEVYYAFRFLSFINIAREWCEDNEIPFATRENKKDL